MASVNRVFLIGNLGADPDVRYTQNATVANFRIATTEVWNDRNGERQERTEWHRIVVWGKQADHCRDYLRKGRSVHVEGKLQTREWEDKEGQKRYTTEIVADRVTFLGSRSEGEGGGGGGYSGGGSGGGGSGGYGGGGQRGGQRGAPRGNPRGGQREPMGGDFEDMPPTGDPFDYDQGNGNAPRNPAPTPSDEDIPF
jgi:single-strand DNA-binding protein